MFVININSVTTKTRGKLYFWLKINMKRINKFEMSGNELTRYL